MFPRYNTTSPILAAVPSKLLETVNVIRGGKKISTLGAMRYGRSSDTQKKKEKKKNKKGKNRVQLKPR